MDYMDYTYLDIAKMIDHSLLNPVLTDRELEAGCHLAVQYDVASACVKPYFLKRCAELLAGSTVAASTVIGFPHGGNKTAVKVAEAEAALRDGGAELDMVVNIGKVLSEDWDYVREDIRAVVDVTHAGGAIVKVIFENCYLQDSHKIRLCEICAEVGANFVKTSTGYGTGGATIADLKLMRKHSPPHIRVKAAGGIRTLDALLEVRAIGVARSGATRTAEMLGECKQRIEAGVMTQRR
jgi:deoxyribose-phosphate aldolase